MQVKYLWSINFLFWGWSYFLTLKDKEAGMKYGFWKPAQIRAWFVTGIHHQVTAVQAIVTYPKGGTTDSFVPDLTMLYILHPCELASSFSNVKVQFSKWIMSINRWVETTTMHMMDRLIFQVLSVKSLLSSPLGVLCFKCFCLLPTSIPTFDSGRQEVVNGKKAKNCRTETTRREGKPMKWREYKNK